MSRYTALNYDHRLVDGREAVTFLCSVRDKLEDCLTCCDCFPCPQITQHLRAAVFNPQDPSRMLLDL